MDKDNQAFLGCCGIIILLVLSILAFVFKGWLIGSIASAVFVFASLFVLIYFGREGSSNPYRVWGKCYHCGKTRWLSNDPGFCKKCDDSLGSMAQGMIDRGD